MGEATWTAVWALGHAVEGTGTWWVSPDDTRIHVESVITQGIKVILWLSVPSVVPLD